VLTNGERRPLEELVFLNRGSVTLRTLLVVIAAAGSGIAGYKLFLLHQDLVLRSAAGAHLTALETFVAQAPTPVTVLIGWVAALCFGLALLRLRGGPFEPAVSPRRVQARSVSELRRGLRREYTLVRMLLVVVVLVTAVDVARAISFAVGTQHSGSTAAPAALYLEAAGFVVATLVLIAYARGFGSRIAHLGAI
jgi:hypothetical protein